MHTFRNFRARFHLEVGHVVGKKYVQILIIVKITRSTLFTLVSGDEEKLRDELGVYAWARGALVSPIVDFSNASYFVRGQMYGAERAYCDLNAEQKQYLSDTHLPLLINFVDTHIGGAANFSGSERWRWNGAVWISILAHHAEIDFSRPLAHNDCYNSTHTRKKTGTERPETQIKQA